MARTVSVKLALATALAAAVLVIPSRASAQAEDYDASYLAEGYDDPYLAEGYDDPYLAEGYDDPYLAEGYDDPYLAEGYDDPYLASYLDAYDDANVAAFRSRDRADAGRWRPMPPYGYRRFDRGDYWHWRMRPYRYRYGYYYGRPRGFRYWPYQDRYYDDFYRRRDFDRRYDWRWRTWPEEGREFGRGFAPEQRNRPFEGKGRSFENRGRSEGGGLNRGVQRQGAVAVPRTGGPVPQAPVEYASEEDTYMASDEDAGTYGWAGRDEDMGESGASGSDWKDQPWESERPTTMPVDRE